MNLREMGAIFEEDVPECVLDEPLEQHFIVDLQEYKHAVQAFWFDSGNPDNPSARSYVFYFFRGEIDKYRRPDDIMTFKVKFDDFSRIHIIDQYLGGTAYGTVNAPPLAVRDSWRPGWISEEGRRQLKAISSGRYDLVPEPTVRSYSGTSPDSPSTETDSTRPDQISEEEKRKWMKRMAYAIGVALVIAFFYNAC